MIRRADIAPLFAAKLDLTPAQAAIVARLWLAGGAWVSTRDLNILTADASRMFDHAANLRADATIKTHVCHIRQKLGADFILGHSQYGFTLGALGVSTCKRITSEAA